MRKNQVPVILFLTLVIPLAYSATVTHEEMFVRQTYAKLAYAVDLNNIHQAIDANRAPNSSELSSAIARNELHFELSDFSIGNLAEISQRPINQFVTRPTGEDVLLIVPHTLKHTEELKENSEIREVTEINAHANWKKGIAAPAEVWNSPAGEIFRQITNTAWYSRYAAFTVKVSLHGRSRTYKAMFIFGRNDKGEEEVITADNVTGTSALDFIARSSVYPSTLIETLGRQPAVDDWLRMNQVTDASCVAGKRTACCNPVSLKCGVAAQDLQVKPKSISKVKTSTPVYPYLPSRLEPASFQGGPSEATEGNAMFLADCGDWSNQHTEIAVGNGWGYEEHATGGHSWEGAGLGTCVYEGENGFCNATATAQPAILFMTEEGGMDLTHYLYSHLTGVNATSATSWGTNPSATTTLAGAVKDCLLGVFCAGVFDFNSRGHRNIWI